MSKTIDLNADLGEDESEDGIARDLAMMRIVSSCNIACGGHAGSPANMERMLVAAAEHSVAPGAHPSYPDRDNFGRISLDIALSDLRKALHDQLTQIREISNSVGVKLRHIKPHGALYNDAQDQELLAETLVDLAVSESLALVGMPNSVIEEKANTIGIEYIAEAFIDRRYRANGRLLPRNETGAVIADGEDRLEQGLALAIGGPVISNEGKAIGISAQTLCLHSDSSGALSTAQLMRKKLRQAGISIRAATSDNG